MLTKRAKAHFMSGQRPRSIQLSAALGYFQFSLWDLPKEMRPQAATRKVSSAEKYFD